jgi:hypothetical protein
MPFGQGAAADPMGGGAGMPGGGGGMPPGLGAAMMAMPKRRGRKKGGKRRGRAKMRKR